MNIWIFIAIFTTIMALLNLYTYKRFLKKLSPPFNHYAWVVPLFLLILEILFSLDRVLHLLPQSKVIYYFVLSSIGVTTALFMMALLYDVNLSVSRRIPYQPERRKFIKIIFDSTILILAFTYLFKGFKGAIDRPRLNVVDVAIKDFGETFTIMQLSDVHVGKTIKKDAISDMVRRVNDESPDMVVLTGDIIDDRPEYVREDLLPFKELKADTYFILGNHEYFHGVDQAIELMRELGVHVLLDDSLVINEKFNLIGLKDLMGKRMNHHEMELEKAYENISLLHNGSVVQRERASTQHSVRWRQIIFGDR